MYRGLGIVIYVGFVIWAILHISDAPIERWAKVVWILAVIFAPFAGPILWFAIGPRGRVRL